MAIKRAQIHDKGIWAYQEAYAFQHELFAQGVQKKKYQHLPENHFILCEHPPVFTLGKRANEGNFLENQMNLGADVVRINRGGDITFHGPGQLVVYPILDLDQYQIGLRTYIDNLEEIVIRLLASYGLSGARVAGSSGVWMDVGLPTERKVAAIGVRASRHITMHGLALNVSTNLAWFDKIIPCGIPGKGVTSLQKELGREVDMKEVKSRLTQEFQLLFEGN